LCGFGLNYNLAQDTVKWRDIERIVMSFDFPIKKLNFLPTWTSTFGIKNKSS